MYEMLLKSNSWSPALGGLQFKAMLLTHTATFYCVIVIRVDFCSNEDIETIITSSHIFIERIRWDNGKWSQGLWETDL